MASDHQPPAQQVFTGNCPKCGAAVRCEIELGKNTCWCFTVKRQDNETEWGDDCMCRSCLGGKK